MRSLCVTVMNVDQTRDEREGYALVRENVPRGRFLAAMATKHLRGGRHRACICRISEVMSTRHELHGAASSFDVISAKAGIEPHQDSMLRRRPRSYSYHAGEGLKPASLIVVFDVFFRDTVTIPGA
ncbi:protein of unknown function [Nitrospira japonica]|uniref:Uncharacterized protein n=1 Tax=Nitrospira japonica TaxID=1325564 RepID=A0A1W1IAC4_9BACT|nr:protein of unknown function [Nitrospira japonica]